MAILFSSFLAVKVAPFLLSQASYPIKQGHWTRYLYPGNFFDKISDNRSAILVHTRADNGDFKQNTDLLILE